MKKLFFTLIIIKYIGTLNSNAQSIAAGGWHSVVICSDKTVKAFGENNTGQLGNGDNTDQNQPVSAGSLNNIIAVSAGGDQLEAHSMALKSDGTVWCWGSNLYGQLGNASTTNTNTPVQSLLVSGMTAISAGGWHSVALKNDGTVWTWGWNMDGQLGDGTTTDRIVLGQVNGLSDIVAISAGTYHVLALKSDGTVWAWGDNQYGQIGNGNTGTDVTSPIMVNGLNNVVKISAGRFFSLAVKNDGTVWTWGQNQYGQLGNSTTNDSNTPVQVSNLNDVNPKVVATGAFHCVVMKNDGSLWAWGRNTYGNLSDNTVTHRSLPIQMQGLSDAEGAAAGTNFTIVYKSDGSFWGCGRNASGQLGDGTLTQHNILTQSTGMCPIISGIKESKIKQDSRITIAPNPSNTGIYKIMGIEDIAKIQVVNILGNKVLENNFFDCKNNTIDISNEASGLYILNIYTAKSLSSYRLIKH
ncbi:MAG: T9SS type A sorting domain-containing protein [Bacteroidia bacterium]|nr:T9SS type A sorting domain-containing protein [Bacteroidia bacterium]MCZ2249554.1 T9SS type A sorting domain-containing protein [Bacteroidia bacterium]